VFLFSSTTSTSSAISSIIFSLLLISSSLILLTSSNIELLAATSSSSSPYIPETSPAFSRLTSSLVSGSEVLTLELICLFFFCFCLVNNLVTLLFLTPFGLPLFFLAGSSLLIAHLIAFSLLSSSLTPLRWKLVILELRRTILTAGTLFS
jgi:hypothetical protein